jgi:6-pyruvoyl-tetrahydropterin synthase
MEKGTYVFCTTRFVGFHRWPDAPKEVAYLQANHRHEFRVKVLVEVQHNDRHVEFITLKDHTDKTINHLKLNERKDHWDNVQSLSCEMMANRIASELHSFYGYVVYSVEVSEDGENGAILVC